MAFCTLQIKVGEHNFSWDGIRHLNVGCFFLLLCCEKIVKKLGQQLHLSWEFRTEAGMYWFLKSFLWSTQRGVFIFGTVFACLCFGSFQGSMKIITYICPHQVSNDYYFSIFYIGCFRLVVFWIAAKQMSFFLRTPVQRAANRIFFPGLVRTLTVLCYFNFSIALFLILKCYWSVNTLSLPRHNKTMLRLVDRMKEKQWQNVTVRWKKNGTNDDWCR